MKKVLLLLLSVILTLFVVAAAGCNTANEVVDKSLKYNIDTRTYWDDIDGSFKIKVNSGIVVRVKFTVKGFDGNSNQLWSRNFNYYYRGFEPQDDPHVITFSYSYYHEPESTTTPDKYTNYITVTGIEIIKETSNEWMGWTFGTLSAGATLAVIALFIISKLKSTNEMSSEEDS